MTSSLLSLGTILGLNEAGVLSVLLAIAFACMAITVAALLRQSYKDQKPEVLRVHRRVRSRFLD